MCEGDDCNKEPCEQLRALGEQNDPLAVYFVCLALAFLVVFACIIACSFFRAVLSRYVTGYYVACSKWLRHAFQPLYTAVCIHRETGNPYR